MLIDFTVRNYKSIKNEVSLNMESDNTNIHHRNHVVPIENGQRHLYPFSAIYGANASGKSNVIDALKDFVSYIINSNKLNITEKIPCYKPFRLDTSSRQETALFQIEVFVEKTTYIYTVELNQNEVQREELYFLPETKKELLFKREKNNESINVDYGSLFTNPKKSIEDNLTENRLLFTLYANSADKTFRNLYLYFNDILSNFNIIELDDNSLSNMFLQLETSVNNSGILSILQAADINLENIKLNNAKVNQNQLLEVQGMIEKTQPELSELAERPKFLEYLIHSVQSNPQIGHSVYENNQKLEKVEYFDLQHEESKGTVKLYKFAPVILQALSQGGTVIIDEFNSSLHPYICEFIIQLFSNEEINTNSAQLIVATHDLHILDLGILKREQVWFTEKDKYGVTDLFSMDEFENNNPIQDNTSFAEFYITGRFGAIPRINTNQFKGAFVHDKKN